MLAVTKVRTISKHHFNRDMDDYLKTRRSGDKKKWKFDLGLGAKKKKPQQEVPMEVPEHEVRNVLEKKPVQDKRLLEPVEADEESQGFFKGLFSSLFGKKVDYEDAGEPVEEAPAKKESGELDPEVVEVLKIAGKWINKMPPELKQEFKESQDFAKYKFYLDKWGLTKKKE